MVTALLLAALLQDPAQEPKREDVLAKVDRAKVDAAIKKAVDWLWAEFDKGAVGPFDIDANSFSHDELVLLTFVHAGVDRADERFQKLLKRVTEAPLQRTYAVSLQAMALVRLDKVRWQWRIAQCAQFLIDNQGQNGGWSYGKPVPVDHFRAPAKPPTGNTLARVAVRHNPKTVKDRPSECDASNSQYAALGLRAAHEAAVVIPAETIRDAAKFWETNQDRNGGWSYIASGSPNDGSTGSMTAGGLGSLACYDYMMGTAARLDPRCKRARQWLADRFAVAEHAGLVRKDGNRKWGLYYYLYALERAGSLFGTELFGAHEWYVEGANHILSDQHRTGSWAVDLRDTCWAVLFLRRSTDDWRPDVATGDKKR
jgi:hypothetical protein